eukprot:TRINITY_DN10585_c0_g1_i12.p1 TRINITY_DN10585_c0_g1~~TRINITY_DN10585_c0_g1_i12.p1  ORF type:complete len:197 (-),score=47.17 TRINITY_DN10585_c0_g1_i12:141-731(-)
MEIKASWLAILLLFSLSRGQSEACPGEFEERLISPLLDLIIPDEFKRGLNFTLPKYHYCGPGTPIIERLRDWENNMPRNKLDLACLYHDLAYSNWCCTYAGLRWADYALIKAAKDVYKEGGWKSDFLLKIEAKTLIAAVELKIKLEDLKVFDPKVYLIKTKEGAEEVANLLRTYSLPGAWDLGFFYENDNLCKPLV